MKYIDESAVLNGYREGLSLRDLATKHEVSVNPIRRVLLKHGVEIRPTGRRGSDRKPRLPRSGTRGPEAFSPDERSEIKRLFLAGETQVKLADSFHCGASTIARILRSEGVEPGTRGQQQGRHHAWKGGRIVNDEGYVLVRVDPTDELARAMAPKAKYILEHRLVMARHLGRPLLRSETVHHGPGGKQDNRIENLELWPGRHPKGQRVEDLVSYAREILDLYGDLVPVS